MSASLAAAKQTGQEAAFHSERVKTTKEVCFFLRLLGEFQTAFKQKEATRAASKTPGSDKAEASSDDGAIDRFPAGLLTQAWGGGRMSNQVCEKGQG